MDGVLVRFGEIGIKSPPVRRAMLRRLEENLLSRMVADQVEGDVRREGARLWLVGPDVERLADLAATTFGVVSVSPARRVAADLKGILSCMVEVATKETGWTRFAVRARREGEHPFGSQDLAVRGGSAVWKATEAMEREVAVDLDAPELEVNVEVRPGAAFIYTKKRPGPGGLPVGTQGHVAAFMDHPDAALACWLMLRRGCKVTPVGEADPRLRAWGLRTTGVTAVPPDVVAVVGAERTGEPLRSAALPVLRPLYGLAPQEVERWREVAGL